MFIKCLKVGQIETNCYILSDRVSGIAAVIDPGAEAGRILAALRETQCEAKIVLLTHGHFDHITAVPEVIAATGASLAVCGRELALLNDPQRNLTATFSQAASAQTPFTPDRLLHDGDTVEVGSLTLTVIETPGHTPGSCCFLCQDMLFSGDTLFHDGAGRTDFPGGDVEALRQSIARLAALPGDYQVLPGHGEFTTLAHERLVNPFAGVKAPERGQS